MHTAECAETATMAEVLQGWDTTPDARGVSWHYAVDSDSITQSVRDGDRANSVGRNASQETGIHVELAGRAKQTAEQWADDYSRAQLALTARLVAHLCREHDIPAARIGATQLRAGERGIYGHADVTRAWPGTTTHYDPGVDFPWDAFIAAVRNV
ncbi:MAG: N-acetylmuramoyl-L-alanine amidase [Gemmatimonadaceae bacterium]|nr:N-acetylmuramoyl-L-alanine amidase [Gemmatimonadaceae bacterium]